jgi:hypothetical protein
MLDTMRGWPSGGTVKRLWANGNDSEANAAWASMYRSTTGFQPAATDSTINTNGATYIYMAIRSASAPAITWPTSIEWAGGVTPSTPAEGATDVFTFTTDDTGTSYTGVKSIDNAS